LGVLPPENSFVILEALLLFLKISSTQMSRLINPFQKFLKALKNIKLLGQLKKKLSL